MGIGRDGDLKGWKGRRLDPDVVAGRGLEGTSIGRVGRGVNWNGWIQMGIGRIGSGRQLEGTSIERIRSMLLLLIVPIDIVVVVVVIIKSDEREREHENTGWQTWTKNGSEHSRCERLVTYEYTMNSARMNNSSHTEHYVLMLTKRFLFVTWLCWHCLGP